MKLYDLKKEKKFITWLNKMGAEVLDPTNQFEVIRFKTQNGVSVIYTGKKGITFTGESKEAWHAFDAGRSWKAVDRKRKNLRAKKSRLAARDGKKCFAHGTKRNFDDLTVEHLLNFSHGGNDNESNLVLMCKSANEELGNLPLAKKLEKIIKMRGGDCV